MSKEWRKGAAPALAGLAIGFLTITGCNSSPNGVDAVVPGSILPGGTPGGSTGGGNPGGGTTGGNIPAYTTAVLLYEGDGVAGAEAQSVESILTSAKISYKAVSSSQINAMTSADWAKYGMMYVPGGLASTMSDSLTSNAIGLLQDSIRAGMSYVGICAGAFLAGDYGSWGLALAPLDFDYYIAEYQGIDLEAVDISFPTGSPNGSQMSMIWYGGPKLDGFGSVVGKYSNGTVAIAETSVGDGLVILSGVHPDAPASWRSGTGITDTQAQDFAYVVTLVQAALQHAPLPSF